MKVFFQLLLLVMISVVDVRAEEDVNPEVVKLIGQFKIVLCNNDSAGMISILEKLRHDYPTDGMLIITNKALADIYASRGKREQAIDLLQYTLTYQPTTYSFRGGETECDKRFEHLSWSRSRADICISLSKLYLSKNMFDSSLYYLTLADDTYLPYKGCGNGVLMARSHLSTYFARHYLAAGDTASAINRLLDYFMEPDGNMRLLSQQLKFILLKKYTQDELNAVIDKGIANMRLVPAPTNRAEQIVELTLFSHTIKRYNWGGKDIAACRALVAQRSGIIYLKQDY